MIVNGEQLRTMETYQIVLGEAGPVSGVYLGRKTRRNPHRVLVRAREDDKSYVDGTPRVYQFREGSLEGNVLKMLNPRAADRLNEQELTLAEATLKNRKI